MANVTITGLVAATGLLVGDLFEIVQSGASKKVTMQLVSDMVQDLNSFEATVGDGTNVDIVVTHNLGTRDVHVTCRRAGTPWDQISVNNDATTTNTITLHFGVTPPAANTIRVKVSK